MRRTCLCVKWWVCARAQSRVITIPVTFTFHNSNPLRNYWIVLRTSQSRAKYALNRLTRREAGVADHNPCATPPSMKKQQIVSELIEPLPGNKPQEKYRENN